MVGSICSALVRKGGLGGTCARNSCDGPVCCRTLALVNKDSSNQAAGLSASSAECGNLVNVRHLQLIPV
eukprot:4337802-Pleurochrysis_carterae.AAC.5